MKYYIAVYLKDMMTYVGYDNEPTDSFDSFMLFDTAEEALEWKESDEAKEWVDARFEVCSTECYDIGKEAEAGVKIKDKYVMQQITDWQGKRTWWISKKGMTVAAYCFTDIGIKDTEIQLKNMDSYIIYFKEKFEK